MREIKFRAWNKEHQAMEHSFCVGANGKVFGVLINRSELRVQNIDLTETLELMQYTGLLDKKGVEIYEGDILARMANDYQPEYRGKWKVIYREGAFFGQGENDEIETWLPYWNPDGEIEVIGNIYENPELVK